VVEVHPKDLTTRTQFEVRIPEQHGQQRRLHRRLRVVLAAEALAEPAEGAGLERQSFRIGVWLTQVAGGLRIGVVAQALGCLTEKRRPVWLLLRGCRVLARARIFEDVAAGNLPALEVAGLAARAEQVLEAIVIRFELREAHAPILDRHLRW